MTADTATRFHARFRRVLEYIDAHLDEALPLERLSDVAAFSKFHFQRQFTELFQIGVAQYVQLLRLHRAGYKLAYRAHLSITTIAHDSGYDGAEAFARAFRKKLGQSPSEFRERPNLETWHALQHQLSELRNRHMSLSHTSEAVRIEEFTQPESLFTNIAAIQSGSANPSSVSSNGASRIVCRRGSVRHSISPTTIRISPIRRSSVSIYVQPRSRASNRTHTA